ncbi:hypothetical protein [Tistlia consotensis]|uniref:hypothetical protein n=1 Tax=Tistlia consotensis TaxID=1321365 RepID=UPI00117F756B|nr:hypothetical protein [Tistlia consotensis]
MSSDLDKARAIVATRKRWVGPPGSLPEEIAKAVAEGIALGRKEGLELAAQIVTDHASRLPTDTKDSHA